MNTLGAALSLTPIVAVALVALWRRGARGAVQPSLAALLGATLFVPARYAERAALSLSQAGEGAVVGAAFDLLVVAPLHMGLAVLAFLPFPRRGLAALEIIGLAASSGAGLGAASAAALFLDPRPSLDFLPARAAVAVAANVFFAAAWGWAVGVEPERRVRGRRFEIAWLLGTAFYGLLHHIVTRRAGTALLAAIPILLAMLVVVGLAAPDVLGERRRSRWSRRVLPAAPSIRAMTEAFQRADRALQPRWIAIGALVTSGVVTSLLVAAIALGRRLALDFTAIDRPDAVGEATAPLLLLGGAVLLAFPISGWLTTRASAAKSVLEAAVAAALAIFALLVLLGLAAPFSVVFAVAFAPVAFGLACLGAWTATAR